MCPALWPFKPCVYGLSGRYKKPTAPVQPSLSIEKDSLKLANPVMQQHGLNVALVWYPAGAGMLISSALFRQASYDDVVEWIWSLGDISSGGVLQTPAL